MTDSCLSYFQKLLNLETLFKYCALRTLKHKEAILAVKLGYEAHFHFLPSSLRVTIGHLRVTIGHFTSHQTAKLRCDCDTCQYYGWMG